MNPFYAAKRKAKSCLMVSLFLLSSTYLLAQFCEAPTGFEFLDINPEGFTAVWDASPGADYYEMEVTLNDEVIFEGAVMETTQTINYPFPLEEFDEIEVALASKCGDFASQPVDITWAFSTTIASVEEVYLTDPNPCLTNCFRGNPDYLEFETALINLLVSMGYNVQGANNLYYEHPDFCNCYNSIMNGNNNYQATGYCLEILFGYQLRDPHPCPINWNPNKSNFEDQQTNLPLTFEVQPNPFGKDIQLTLSAAQGDLVEIRVFDSLGKEVFADQSRSKSGGLFTKQLQLDSLLPGLYYLEVVTGLERQTTKIFKL